MRNTALFYSIAVGLLFCSCNPRITTELVKVATPLPINQDVAVIDLDEEIPANGEVIGEVNIDDAGLTTNCSYDYVVELAKVEARKAGGNALKITRHITPDLYSSCHRISASIISIKDVASGQMAINASNSLIKVAYPRFRFSIQGGLSEFLVFNPVENDPILDQYSKELNSGYNLGTDLTYYFPQFYGIGIKCNMVRTSNSLSGVTIYDNDGISHFGDISDDITVFYVGPTLNYRTVGIENKGAFYLSASAGYNGYYNRACIINRFIANGATLGSSVDVGYDVNLSKKLALGLKLSLTTGLLKELTINNGYTTTQSTLGENTYISLNHIDLTIGLSFIR